MTKEFQGTHVSYRFTVNLHNPEDADILAYLLDKSGVEKQRVLRELIRAGFEAQKKEE